MSNNTLLKDIINIMKTKKINDIDDAHELLYAQILKLDLQLKQLYQQKEEKILLLNKQNNIITKNQSILQKSIEKVGLDISTLEHKLNDISTYLNHEDYKVINKDEEYIMVEKNNHPYYHIKYLSDIILDKFSGLVEQGYNNYSLKKIKIDIINKDQEQQELKEKLLIHNDLNIKFIIKYIYTPTKYNIFINLSDYITDIDYFIKKKLSMNTFINNNKFINIELLISFINHAFNNNVNIIFIKDNLLYQVILSDNNNLFNYIYKVFKNLNFINNINLYFLKKDFRYYIRNIYKEKLKNNKNNKLNNLLNIINLKLYTFDHDYNIYINIIQPIYLFGHKPNKSNNLYNMYHIIIQHLKYNKLNPNNEIGIYVTYIYKKIIKNLIYLLKFY